MRATAPVTDALGMRERILQSAVELFAARGFHGTSVRDLAQAVGIEAASLYYHFPSKQVLLHVLFDQIMNELLDTLRLATLAGGPPPQRLPGVARAHVAFHIARRKETFVSRSELRSLLPAHRRLIVAKRDGYEHAVRELLAEGVALATFRLKTSP